MWISLTVKNKKKILNGHDPASLVPLNDTEFANFLWCLQTGISGGSLKVYGVELFPNKPYVTLLVGHSDTAKQVVQMAMEKYQLDEAENPEGFALVEVCRFPFLIYQFWFIDVPCWVRIQLLQLQRFAQCGKNARALFSWRRVPTSVAHISQGFCECGKKMEGEAIS